jgi:3-isopropylmalate/(R)-2-methylmalate dehydratase small subunit
MAPFTVLTAIAAPMPEPNIDTDMIIRIERLRDLEPDQLGPYAFENRRYRPDGSEAPDFVLNREPYRRARIILAGPNFGCGSSREAAVWALRGFGVRSVIAPSFGPIFVNNCYQNGLLPVVLPEAAVRALIEEVEAAAGRAEVTVDLHECTVIAPSGGRWRFAIDPLRREALLKGLDDVALTLSREAEIAAHEARDRAVRAWLYPAAAWG